MKLLFVTGNPNKAKEAKDILGIEIEQKDIDIPEIQADAEEVVRQKAIEAYRILKEPLIVEDTSVSFTALGGFPGPYIKALVKKNPIENLPKMLSAFDDKSAVGTAIVALIEEEGKPQLFRGDIKGTIVMPRGTSKFDWDLVFQPDGYDKTFAEMTPEQKNSISHRKKAFEAFRRYLEKK